jgi:membrane carboxypeptidase/penicillin-binding protein
MHSYLRRLFVALTLALTVCSSQSAQAATRKKIKQKPIVAQPLRRPPNAAKTLRKHKKVAQNRRSVVNHFSSAASGPWTSPTFVSDNTNGDRIDGEDLTVRRAAVEALGAYNGTVIVADPHTGRILTMVNQKLATSNGYQPCSTVKIVAALAGLSENVIDRTTMLRLYGRTSMNLTNALALSNNNYFANIGVKLGYDRVNYYARLFGLGERAGLNIEGEQPGVLPPAPPKNGGMAMMTSFGEGISLTPLQLTALVSAIANGGTLHYLQHPGSIAEVENFVPRVKRQLTIQQSLPDLIPGMMGAVEYGTARRQVPARIARHRPTWAGLVPSTTLEIES